MKELWKPVPYEPYGNKYLISNLGRVKPKVKSKFSNSKNEYLTWGWNARGRYACVSVYHNGKGRQIDIHRSVALAFLGEPPEGCTVVRHLDGNPKNNSVDNLAWGSASDNMQDMVKHGNSMSGTKNIRAKLTPELVNEIKLKYEGGETQMNLASLYDVHQTQISRIVRGVHWST